MSTRLKVFVINDYFFINIFKWINIPYIEKNAFKTIRVKWKCMCIEGKWFAWGIHTYSYIDHYPPQIFIWFIPHAMMYMPSPHKGKAYLNPHKGLTKINFCHSHHTKEDTKFSSCFEWNSKFTLNDKYVSYKGDPSLLTVLVRIISGRISTRICTMFTLLQCHGIFRNGRRGEGRGGAIFASWVLW